MCLISVFPKGTVKYNDEVKEFISQGFNSNRDGSGFMYKRNGEQYVYLDKGFFDLNNLLRTIRELNLKEEDELVVHHRIGTSGARSSSNTHPFVISTDHEEVVMTKGKTNKPVLTHNGIFGELDCFEKLNLDFSDTYAFARYVLTNTMEELVNDQDNFLKAFRGIIRGSRLCLLFPDRDLMMTGDFKEDNGYYHSNGGYKTYVHNVGGVEYGFPKSGAGMTKSRVLQLPSAEREKLDIKLPITLNDTFIEINNFNYKHFCYTRKDKTDNIVYKFDNYDENAVVNLMWGISNRMGQSVTKDGLHAEYNFHPYKKWETYYLEYVNVIMTLTPSKSLLKKMFKILNRQRHTNLDYEFRFNNVKMSKICAINYYLWFKDTHMNDPSHLLTTGHTPIYSEFNLLTQDVENLGIFKGETEDLSSSTNGILNPIMNAITGFLGKSKNAELIPAD